MIKNRRGILERILSRLNSQKIKQKLFALYVVAFLIPTIIISLSLSFWIQTTLKNWRLKLASSSVQQASVVFDGILNSVQLLSNSLFLNIQVRDTLSRHYDDTQEVYAQYITLSFLDDFLRANENVSSFRYYTENESILDNAYFIKTNEATRNSAWYIDAKNANGKLYWVKKKDNITRKEMLSLVRSIWSEEGKFLAVLSINIDADHIKRFLNSMDNESFISIGDEIAFSSSQIPERENIEFNFDRTLSNETIETHRCKGTRSYIVMTPIHPSTNQRINLVQIIPWGTITRTTVLGLLISILVITVGSIISFLLILIFSRYFANRVNHVNDEIKKMVENNFELGPKLEGTDEFAQINEALFYMTQNIKQLIAEVYQHKINKAQLLSRQNDIRFKMLASQINPHFLFNTLETIRMQALADSNRDVAFTIKLLAKILRHNLDVTDRPVPVMEEIEAIGNYLDIQHLRFTSRISYDIVFLCDIRNIGILPLLIQPIVENSFSHGLEAKTEGGFIYIAIDSEARTDVPGNDLIITIHDNGCGISEKDLEALREKLNMGTVETISSSIGMVNVNQRIKLYYGERYGLEINSKLNEGTTVTIRIPLEPIAGGLN